MAYQQFDIKSLGRYREIPASAMNEQQHEIAQNFIARRGTIPTPFRIFLSSPSLASRLQQLSDYLLRNGLLSQQEVEIAVLVAANRLKSDFVQAAHRRIALEAGVAEGAIDAILSGRDPLLEDLRQSAVHECACAMIDQSPPDSARFEKLIAVLGDGGICEVAAILGFYSTCGFILNFFEVPPPA